MFTGLIEDVGLLRRMKRSGEGVTLELATSIDTSELELGESIAVNGICLTVTRILPDAFTVDATSETLSRTALSRLSQGDGVHLERAVRPMDRLGGHIVQGHVDGVGHIERIRTMDGSWDVFVSIPDNLMPEVIEKGSIAIDGVSLTVNELTGTGIRLTIIPFTDGKTKLTALQPGQPVNIETDVIGKYVRQLFERAGGKAGSGGLKRALIENGFMEGGED